MLLLPLLLITAVLVLARLRIALMFSKRPQSPIHTDALAHVRSFATQYPLHLYPVVAKACELALLKPRLARLPGASPRIVELAIGDGSLSARLFGADAGVTGLDLNPYSLSKALRKPHVGQGIVADCLNPPLTAGSWDVLVAVNFLHHVTDKAAAVKAWSGAAKWLVFNENTPFWASGWTAPYLLAKLGFRRASDRWAHRIEQRSIQHLEPLEVLLQAIGPAAEIVDKVSFFSERTFFYCSVFSFFMRCYGPPTPPLLKKLFLGPLRPFVLSLTVKLAESLIEFDAAQSRAKDSFVAFVCRSRHWVSAATDDESLACPECRRSLDGHQQCRQCRGTYPVKDGMLFLLPVQFNHICDEYRAEIASLIDAEHV